jgi:hypothetical protein
MPTLSQYWFHDRFFGGPFDVWNQPYPEGGWAWISNTGSSAATLVWNRPDSEQSLSTASQLNMPDVLNQVDNLLGGSANRTSGIMTAGVFWPQVPYHDKDPGRHNDWDMLIRVYFNFHIGTPWYCSDANGDISYYLVIYLDGGGHLRGYVDGWSYHYDGGGPFCTGGINDALNAAVPGGVGAVQSVLDNRLALLSGFTFGSLYFLPGSGTKNPGDTSENADQDVAIAVVP